MTAGSTSTRRTRAPGVVNHLADEGPRRSPAGNDIAMEERTLLLAYRVARGVGLSPRASLRLCRRLFRTALPWLDTPHGLHPAASNSDRDPGRRVRARLLTALPAAMPSRVDRRMLERAVDNAVLADELALLPPRQQAAIRWAVQQRYTVAQISERTGWTPQQVIRLLRAGLTTLTVCGQPSAPAGDRRHRFRLLSSCDNPAVRRQDDTILDMSRGTVGVADAPEQRSAHCHVTADRTPSYRVPR